MTLPQSYSFNTKFNLKTPNFQIFLGHALDPLHCFCFTFCSAVGTLLEFLYQSSRATSVVCMMHLLIEYVINFASVKIFSGYATDWARTSKSMQKHPKVSC